LSNYRYKFKKYIYNLYVKHINITIHSSTTLSDTTIACQGIRKDERIGIVRILPCIQFLIEEERHNPVEVKEINNDMPIDMSYVK